eukprot:g22057.t1
MITALLADARRIEGVTPVTLWDASLAPPDVDEIEVVLVTNRAEEPQQFRNLVATTDAAYIIAPEIDQLLEARIQTIANSGGRHLGCSLTAARLAADKRELADVLSKHGLPTIPTAELNVNHSECDFPFPLVVKPRFGAGSQDVRRIDNEREYESWRTEALQPHVATDWIVQPCIAGRAVSAAAIVRADADDIDVLPVCTQRLSNDGRFTYLGGTLDHDTTGEETQFAVDRIVRRACRAIEGLHGYVGFDLILPSEEPCRPVIVEINPRLTTSYLGYRRLTPDNLAQRFLFPDRQLPPIRWDRKRVQFDADGAVAYRSDLLQFMEWYREHGPARVVDVSLKDLSAYLNRLHDRNLAASSVARHLVSIKMFFRYLVLEGVLRESTVELLSSPKLWQRLPKILSPEMIDALLAAPSAEDRFPLRDRSLLAVMYATGCRASEIAGITLADLQVEEGYCRCTGKGNKERIVSLNPVALASIEAYTEVERPLLAQRTDDDALFLTRHGNPMSRIMIWNIVKKYAARIGCSREVSPHTLRHSFATHMLAGGAEIRALQELLGHASISTTQIYTQVEHSRLKAVHQQCHPRG